MKKAFLFTVIIGLIYTGSTAPAGTCYLRDSEGSLYFIETPINYSTDFFCWPATVYAANHTTSALIFLDNSTQNNRTLKIIVFENADLYGWTLEGNLHMTGGASDMKCLISIGVYYDTMLYFGTTMHVGSTPLITMPKILESGVDPRLKPHAPAQWSPP